MARGQQKIQSQQKNAEKKAKAAKGGLNQKEEAKKALKVQCTVCKCTMPDLKSYKQHFDSKHPKADTPEELKGVV